MLRGTTVTIDDAGQITGSGTLNKSGGGTLQLAQAHTGFTGGLNVAEGRLDIVTTAQAFAGGSDGYLRSAGGS